jgi:5-methylcytosine-specific restriction endonuclease McrA
VSDIAGSYIDGPGSDRDNWRSIILLGRNVASYKFALGKSLLGLAREGSEVVSLSELAVPYTKHLCEHLQHTERQGTFASSKFLDACRFYNAEVINQTELLASAEMLGFENVLDAFHTVGPGPVGSRFFIDERTLSIKGIRLTDELMQIVDAPGSTNLFGEVEARWRLVETAWTNKADGEQSIVLYDAPTELLVPALRGKRRSITEVRPALMGYQRGHCFYCFRPIVIVGGSGEAASEVDHFLPHMLMAKGYPVDLDQVWNLVLACMDCNRGPGGKFARLPHVELLLRLAKRNEYLISSHHPLRETLILQSGTGSTDRAGFLHSMYTLARDLLPGTDRWVPDAQGPDLF